MALAHVQDWIEPNGSGSATKTITGTATTAGNLLMAWVNTRTNGLTCTLSDNGGNTWTLVATELPGAGVFFAFICPNANSITSLTATLSGSANKIMELAEFSGAPTTDPVHVFATAQLAESTNPDPVQVTTSVADCLVVGAQGIAVADRTHTLQDAGNWTEATKIQSSQMKILRAHRILTGTATTGPDWHVTSGSPAGGCGITIAIKPAGGGGETPSGEVDLSLAVGLDATGHKRATGSATLGATVGLDVTGAKRSTGTSAHGLDVGLDVTGSKRSTGASTLGLDAGLQVTGHKRASGSVTLGLAVGLDVDGGRPAEEGSGSVGLGLGVGLEVTGRKRASGAVTLELSVALAGTGTKTTSGTVELGIGVGLDPAGAKRTSGDVAFPLTITLDLTGQNPANERDITIGRLGPPPRRWRTTTPAARWRTTTPATRWRTSA